MGRHGDGTKSSSHHGGQEAEREWLWMQAFSFFPAIPSGISETWWCHRHSEWIFLLLLILPANAFIDLPRSVLNNLPDVSQSSQVDNQDDTLTCLCHFTVYKAFRHSHQLHGHFLGARYSSYMIANETPPETGRKQSPFYYANGVYEPDPKKGITGMTLLCCTQATTREDKKGWINCVCSTHFQGGFSHHGGLRVVSRLLTGYLQQRLLPFITQPRDTFKCYWFK